MKFKEPFQIGEYHCVLGELDVTLTLTLKEITFFPSLHISPW